MSGGSDLAHFISAVLFRRNFGLLAVVLVVRLDRYQAAITCPIATVDSCRKVEQATIAGFLLRELRLRARRKLRGGPRAPQAKEFSETL